MRYVIPLSLLLLFSCSNDKQDISHEHIYEFNRVFSFDKEVTLGAFSSTGDILAFFDYVSSSIYIYDIASDTLMPQVPIRRGEGPGERSNITGTSVTRKGEIHIYDVNSLRTVVLSPPYTGDTKDIRLPKRIATAVPLDESSYAGVDITSLDRHIFVFDTGAQDSVIHINENSEVYEDIFNGNIVLKSGELVSMGSRVLFSLTYQPMLLIYDGVERSFRKKISYERSSLDDLEPIVGEDGRRIHLPPEEVDVLFKSFAPLPSSESEVVMLLRGEGDERRYHDDVAYIYDFEREEFTGSFSLPGAAERIVANGDRLFIYIPDEGAVYAVDARELEVH